MHIWGDWPDRNFAEVEEISWWIGGWLRTWTRIPVFQCKEKFGTVRVYCSFGWCTFYSIWRPSHCWVSKYWPYSLDLWLSDHTPFLHWLNKLIIPLQKRAYIWRYKKAVEKWPYLRDEILSCADWGELFEGHIVGYKNQKFCL